MRVVAASCVLVGALTVGVIVTNAEERSDFLHCLDTNSTLVPDSNDPDGARCDCNAGYVGVEVGQSSQCVPGPRNVVAHGRDLLHVMPAPRKETDSRRNL